LVEHIAKYSRALDRASSAPIDLTDTVSGTVKKIGDALTAVSLVNGTAGQAFGGIAAPLGKAATNIAGRWRAKQLGTLVGRADPQIRALVTVVTHFLDTIETTDLAV